MEIVIFFVSTIFGAVIAVPFIVHHMADRYSLLLSMLKEEGVRVDFIKGELLLVLKYNEDAPLRIPPWALFFNLWSIEHLYFRDFSSFLREIKDSVDNIDRVSDFEVLVTFKEESIRVIYESGKVYFFLPNEEGPRYVDSPKSLLEAVSLVSSW